MLPGILDKASFRKLRTTGEADSRVHEVTSQLMSDFTHSTFLSILVLTSLTLSCAGKGTSHMTQDQLLAAIDQGNPPAIVDVRSKSEYESGHVPGALHLPFYAMWSRHTEMKVTPENPIILYCEHGPRAGIAKFSLWTMGYKNVTYLDGHMSGWKEKGFPLEAPQN